MEFRIGGPDSIQGCLFIPKPLIDFTDESRIKSAGTPFCIAANTEAGASGVVKPLMYALPVSGV